MRRPWTVWAGWLVLAMALGVLIGWPTWNVLLRASADGWVNDEALGGSGAARGWVLAKQTLLLVGLTELLALPVGVVLAFCLFRTDLPGRRLMRGLIVLGVFVPLPLQAICWLGAFGNQGRQQALGAAPILVGKFGAAFVHAVAALPWVVLIVGLGMRAVEPELEELGLLEMPGWRVALAITLRRSTGAIVAAAAVVAVMCATDMTVTDLIPLRTYAEEAYTMSQQGLGLATLAVRASAPAFIALVPVLLILGVLLARVEPARLAQLTAPALRFRLGGWRWVAGLFVGGIVVCLAGLPLYGLMWRAGRVGPGLVAGEGAHWTLHGLIGTLRESARDLGPSWALNFEGREVFEPGLLASSLTWAAVSGAAATVLAAGLCWAARGEKAWVAVVIATVAVSLAIPAPVAGVALKLAYLRVRWLVETPGLLIVAQTLRVLPYALVMIWPAVRALPRAWFETAALEGLGPARQLSLIGLPSLWPALVIAWLLTSTLALGELPATYFVSAPGYQPLSMVLWSQLHMGVESRLAGVGLWLLAVVATCGVIAAVVVAARTSPRETNSL